VKRYHPMILAGSETPLHSLVVALIVEMPYSNYQPRFINKTETGGLPVAGHALT
jgi:hypothetical protein